MHGPRRVVGGDVEGLEVVVVVLHLRAFRHLETGIGEEVLDAPQGAGDGVQAPGALTTARQGDVDPLTRQAGTQGLPFQVGAAGLDGLLDLDLGLVDGLAGPRTLLRRQATELLELRRQQARLAQVVHPDPIQGGQLAGRGDLSQGLGLQRGDTKSGFCAHGHCSLCAVEGRAWPAKKKGKGADLSPP